MNIAGVLASNAGGRAHVVLAIVLFILGAAVVLGIGALVAAAIIAPLALAKEKLDASRRARAVTSLACLVLMAGAYISGVGMLEVVGVLLLLLLAFYWFLRLDDAI
jgi:Ca2+/Na+ antiporter